MDAEKNTGAYIYQDGSLIVPEHTPDSIIYREIESDLIKCSFSGSRFQDDYIIPPLGKEDGIRFITLNRGELPAGWKAVPIRQALNVISNGGLAECSGPAGRVLRSWHVSQWRNESRFCGSCGGANRDADTGELARLCSLCGKFEFPRIAPAVITIVINDKGEALLARNKKTVSGFYALIAGFNEAGEDLETTVAREIKEEVNIDVKDICYVRSQPWPFSNSLMIGFTARYNGGELKPDGVEIEDARWFSRDALPSLPTGASVSRYLIDLWIKRKL